MKNKEKWPLSPSMESTQHISLKKQYALFIDGKWVAPSSGKYFPSINPADESHIADISHANEKDVDLAVRAARKAFPSWSALAPYTKP